MAPRTIFAGPPESVAITRTPSPSLRPQFDRKALSRTGPAACQGWPLPGQVFALAKKMQGIGQVELRYQTPQLIFLSLIVEPCRWGDELRLPGNQTLCFGVVLAQPLEDALLLRDPTPTTCVAALFRSEVS